jgi:hypothetical protein
LSSCGFFFSTKSAAAISLLSSLEMAMIQLEALIAPKVIFEERPS